jgi:hypothetical protein
MEAIKQINLQVALNPENKSHMDLLKWIDTETKNRSSFIRETLFMRMMGLVGGMRSEFTFHQSNEVDVDDALSIIQV